MNKRGRLKTIQLRIGFSRVVGVLRSHGLGCTQGGVGSRRKGRGWEGRAKAWLASKNNSDKAHPAIRVLLGRPGASRPSILMSGLSASNRVPAPIQPRLPRHLARRPSPRPGSGHLGPFCPTRAKGAHAPGDTCGESRVSVGEPLKRHRYSVCVEQRRPCDLRYLPRTRSLWRRTPTATPALCQR
jgi:hypothetical protein